MNRPLRLAYLGPAGTNTEEAARLYFLGNGWGGEGGRLDLAAGPMAGSARRVELVSLPAVPDIMWAVHRGDADEGVVPIENSLEGAVAVTLDMLAHEVELQIRAEVIVPIRHALLVPRDAADAKTADIRSVYSHPQALAQCRKSLDRLLPGVRRIPASSTAEAARLVAAGTEAGGEAVAQVAGGARDASGEGRPGSAGGVAAAIATRLAGEMYGLTVHAADVQDRADNATRFVVISREDAPPSGRDKSSIVVGGRTDRPGVLFHILQPFAERNINLTRIESRPAKRALGEYLFFIDLEGHREEPAVQEALDAVRAQCGLFRVLGSYPVWQEGGESKEGAPCMRCGAEMFWWFGAWKCPNCGYKGC